MALMRKMKRTTSRAPRIPGPSRSCRLRDLWDEKRVALQSHSTSEPELLLLQKGNSNSGVPCVIPRFPRLYSQVPGKMQDKIPRRGKVTAHNSKNQDAGPRLPPPLQIVATFSREVYLQRCLRPNFPRTNHLYKSTSNSRPLFTPIQ